MGRRKNRHRRLSREQQAQFDEIYAKYGNDKINKVVLLGEINGAPGTPLHRYVYDCDVETAAQRYYLSKCAEVLRRARFEFQAPGNVAPRETRRVVTITRETDEGESETFQLATEKAIHQYPDLLEEECEQALREIIESWEANIGAPTVRRILLRIVEGKAAAE
jgi:hypothetical protein